MTLKVLASGKVRVNLALGANSQVFGTMYTVPAATTVFIKELVITTENAIAGVADMQPYILKSGDTDLTAVASNTGTSTRAVAENKTAITLSATISRATPTILARNTILATGDSVRLWVFYGAITPGNTDAFFQISGDEF